MFAIHRRDNLSTGDVAALAGVLHEVHRGRMQTTQRTTQDSQTTFRPNVSGPPVISLREPGELVASTPHLLGFHPAGSLVVFGLRGGDPPGAPDSADPGRAEIAAVRTVLRADLPPVAAAIGVANTAVAALRERHATSVALLVVDGRRDGVDPPHRDVVTAVTAVLTAAGLPARHRLWASDTTATGRWRCYDHADCEGAVDDPHTTPLADAAAEAGLVTYRRREDFAATLAPQPDAVLRRRTALLAAASAAVEPGGDPPQDADDWLADAEGWAENGAVDWAGDTDTVDGWAGGRVAARRSADRFTLLRAAVRSVGPEPPELTDDEVVRLTDALGDHRVRDLCLDFDAIPDVPAAERLWTALARATPEPERSEPACVLAYSAYARGDGALANIALDVAERAEPGHRLCELLREAVSSGVAPDKMRAVAIAAARSARRGPERGRNR